MVCVTVNTGFPKASAHSVQVFVLAPNGCPVLGLMGPPTANSSSKRSSPSRINVCAARPPVVGQQSFELPRPARRISKDKYDARHSDVRLTLGVYTHLGVHDRTAAIESLPAPPKVSVGPQDEAKALRATGTEGPRNDGFEEKTTPREVPTVVPRGAENGAVHLASETLQIAPLCTETADERTKKDDPQIVVNPSPVGTSCIELHVPASVCTGCRGRKGKVSPTGFEPVTFGSGGRRPIRSPCQDTLRKSLQRIWLHRRCRSFRRATFSIFYRIPYRYEWILYQILYQRDSAKRSR